MIMRWISDVPSKMVKIVDVEAVSAGQRPAAPVVSARIQHGLFEGNDGFRPARVCCRSSFEGTPRRHCGRSGYYLSGPPPQHQDLRVLHGVIARQQHQPAEHRIMNK
jgi:hypothetical protein